MKTEEQIEKRAKELVFMHSADRALNEGRKRWYIAGATEWYNKAIDHCVYNLEVAGYDEIDDGTIIEMLKSLKFALHET